MRMRNAIPFLLALSLAACGGKGEPGGGEAPPTTPGQTPEEPAAAPGEGAVAQADAFIAKQKIDKSSPGWKTKLPKPPQFTFEAGKAYYWVMQTNQGTMKFRLWPDVAPMHVSSTIYLTRLGMYDDTVFHRVIHDFMAQAGDPLGSGMGGPGYKYPGEFKSGVFHDRPGLLSMANAGPGTDGSQFFITFKETPWLDGKHTLFGEIVEGADIVKKLNDLGGRNGGQTPRERITLDRATIEVR
jgi:cyclophilin family peptidyl-prolyl cis-trans isomerase